MPRQPPSDRSTPTDSTTRETDTTRYLGATNAGNTLYFDMDDRRIFEGEYDHDTDRVTPIGGTNRSLEPRESVGEALESLGDSLDWDSLSEFADEKIQRGDE